MFKPILSFYFNMKNLRISFGGDISVGKSSIVQRFTKNTFFEFNEPTIGASFFCKTLNYNNEDYKIEIWDTAGQERYYSLSPMYFKKTDAVVLVYDITSYDSFQKLKYKWYPDLIKYINHHNIVILGNKIDLNYNRKVNNEEVFDFVERNNLLFFEVSAKDNYKNIENCFIQIIKNSNFRKSFESNKIDVNNKDREYCSFSCC